MNVVVVDFQGFKDEDNNFIIKELAVGSVNNKKNNCHSRFLFKPPYDLHELPRRTQLANLWLTRNFHGLEWYEGNIEYDRLTIILQTETLNATIVCKGWEKAVFLSSLLQMKVYNLDEVIGRRLSDIPFTGGACHYHGDKCAVQNVLRILQWIMKVMTLFEVFNLSPLDSTHAYIEENKSASNLMTLHNNFITEEELSRIEEEGSDWMDEISMEEEERKLPILM